MKQSWIHLLIFVRFYKADYCSKCLSSLDALAIIISSSNVKCGLDFSLLHFGNCMTYTSSTEATEYGPCPYIAHYNTTTVDRELDIQLPNNVSLLNEFMCGPLNREGEL